MPSEMKKFQQDLLAPVQQLRRGVVHLEARTRRILGREREELRLELRRDEEVVGAIAELLLEGVGHIVSGTVRFGTALTARKYPSLRLQTEMLEGMGHGDAGLHLLGGDVLP